MTTQVISANTGTKLINETQNLYTSPAGTSSLISKMTLTNTETYTSQAWVYLSDSNTVNDTAQLQQLTIPPLATISVSTAAQHVIPAGGSVLASTDSNAVVIAKLSVVTFT